MIIKKKYKLGRRLGAGVNEKCQTQKFLLSESRRKPRVPKHPRKKTDYGMQLIEKQRVRFMYGITEKQLSNYVKDSGKIKGVAPVEQLYSGLETRLDNVVYRAGFATTRRAARQMVSHGHVAVNGKATNIASRKTLPGDVVSIKQSSLKGPLFIDVDKKMAAMPTYSWLAVDPQKKQVKVQGKPKKEQDSFINLNAVLEFYSR